MSEPQEPYGRPSADEEGWPTQPVPPVPPVPAAPPVPLAPPIPGTGVPGPDPGQPGGQWQHQYGAAPYWNPYPSYPPQGPKRRGRMATALVGAVLLAGGAGVGLGHAFWHSPSAAPTASTGQFNGSGANPFGAPNGTGNGAGGSGSGSGNGAGSGNGSSSTAGGASASEVSAVAQKVDPALVDVNSTFSYQSAQGAGTGIVLTSNGEILTNNHVINGATSVSVTDVGNGKTYSAAVVGYDDSQDVAVLQLQGASGLTTANLGDSGNVSVGQAVVALGNAGGVGGTPSSAGGSVTALNSSITASDELDGTNEQLSGLIAVNADVQSGDSGGSLVTTSGQVIGMDTAASESYSLQSQSGGGAGQGFAIPIDSALSIAKQIEAGQSSSTVHVGQTAFLGVMVATGSGSGSGSQGGGANGVVGGAQTVNGAQIGEVVPNGAAQQAGLTAGDVITSIDGQSVGSAADLTGIIGGLKPGQSVPIGYTDSFGQSQTGTVDLTAGPPA